MVLATGDALELGHRDVHAGQAVNSARSSSSGSPSRVAANSASRATLGYFDADVIIGDSCTAVPDADLFHYGVLSSLMHVAWLRVVCGRLKSDFRYPNKLVYNNFPWPEGVPDKRKSTVEVAAQAVLDARLPFLPPRGGSTLADLYDPLTIPVALAKAYAVLDRVVDRCYRSQEFQTDRERVEYLFGRYEALTAPLLPAVESPRRRGARRRVNKEPPSN